MSGGKSIKRTLILKGIKILLITITLCIFTILFIIPIFQTKDDKIDIFYDDLQYRSINQNSKNESSLITKPEFFGIDDSNQKYKISATKGIQNDANNVSLFDVTANISLKDNSLFAVLAKSADIEIESNILKLVGDVTLFFNDEAILITDYANLNYKSKEAHSNSGVILKSNYGNIASQNFEANDSYSHIKFDGGRVKTVLFTKDETHKQN